MDYITAMESFRLLDFDSYYMNDRLCEVFNTLGYERDTFWHWEDTVWYTDVLPFCPDKFNI